MSIGIVQKSVKLNIIIIIIIIVIIVIIIIIIIIKGHKPWIGINNMHCFLL